MRFTFPATLLVASVSGGAAFAPTFHGTSSKTALFSTLKARPATASISKKFPVDIENNFREINDASNEIVPLTGEEIQARLQVQLEKLREKDRTSKKLAKEVCILKAKLGYGLQYRIKQSWNNERSLPSCKLLEDRTITLASQNIQLILLSVFTL